MSLIKPSIETVRTKTSMSPSGTSTCFRKVHSNSNSQGQDPACPNQKMSQIVDLPLPVRSRLGQPLGGLPTALLGRQKASVGLTRDVLSHAVATYPGDYPGVGALE